MAAAVATPSARAAGLGLLAAGVLPFAAARALYDPAGGDVGGPELTCPFRALTGLPCPLCGSTRAVALAAHGDLGFTQLNLVVVLALAALAVAGLVVLAAPRSRARATVAAVLARPGPVLLALGVAAWAWTLTHRGAIVS